MSDYKFVTVWTIDAPLADVWREIKDTDSWPEWWKGVVRVVELKKGNDDGLGSIHRSTWRSALPYTLEFDSEIVRIDEMRLIEAQAFGELEGRGLWQFFETGNGTRVQYDWTVKTTKKWMNLIAPLARSFFRWNHDTIMGWGEAGLRKRLNTGPTSK